MCAQPVNYAQDLTGPSASGGCKSIAMSLEDHWVGYPPWSTHCASNIHLSANAGGIAERHTSAVTPPAARSGSV